jgi:hypothetical protein
MINWIPTQGNAPKKLNEADDYEISSPRLLLWVKSTKKDLEQAMFGNYNFISNEFIVFENIKDIIITHYAEINKP